MDVSCVFVRRDNEYYDFRPEIETKNKSESILGLKNNLSSISLKDGGTNIVCLCMNGCRCKTVRRGDAGLSEGTDMSERVPEGWKLGRMSALCRLS